MTAKTIGSSINSEKDLIGKYVAAVATDAPRRYLERIGANVIPVKTLDEGIEMLKEGKVKALVHDGPRLSYIANRVNKREKKESISTTAIRIHPQSLALDLPKKRPPLEREGSIGALFWGPLKRGGRVWKKSLPPKKVWGNLRGLQEKQRPPS